MFARTFNLMFRLFINKKQQVFVDTNCVQGRMLRVRGILKGAVGIC